MRCSNCGSKNIALITRNDGYSIKKGVIGTALFGTVGAVAGIDGKKKQVFHCSDCGGDFDSPMSSDIENSIEKALREKNATLLNHFISSYHNLQIPNMVDSSVNVGNFDNDFQHETEHTKSLNPDFDTPEVRNAILEILVGHPNISTTGILAADATGNQILEKKDINSSRIYILINRMIAQNKVVKQETKFRHVFSVTQGFSYYPEEKEAAYSNPDSIELKNKVLSILERKPNSTATEIIESDDEIEVSIQGMLKCLRGMSDRVSCVEEGRPKRFSVVPGFRYYE